MEPRANSDRAPRQRGQRVALWIAAALILHPLSMGPVNYLHAKGYVPWTMHDLDATFYAPENWLIRTADDHAPSINHAYYYYVLWWRKAAEGE